MLGMLGMLGMLDLRRKSGGDSKPSRLESGGFSCGGTISGRMVGIRNTVEHSVTWHYNRAYKHLSNFRGYLDITEQGCSPRHQNSHLFLPICCHIGHFCGGFKPRNSIGLYCIRMWSCSCNTLALHLLQCSSHSWWSWPSATLAV